MGGFSWNAFFQRIKVRVFKSIYIAGVLIVAGLLAGYLSRSHSDETLIRADIVFADELCTTDVCKDAARTIEENRFLMVDPCEDFDEFVCGGWKERHPLISESDSISQFDKTDEVTDSRVKDILESSDKNDYLESTKSARKFYRACLSTSANVNRSWQSLVDQLSAWGGWPITTNQKWQSDKFDWKNVTVELARTTPDTSPLLNILIRRHPKDTSRTVIQLAPASPEICTIMSKIDNPDAVRDFISEPAKDVLNFTKSDLPDRFGNDVEEVTEFAKKLCKIVNKPFESTDNDTFPTTKLTDFQIMSEASSGKGSFSRISWKLLLKEYIYGSGVKLRLDDVIVVQPESLLELMKLIDTTPQRTLANYFLLHKVKWIKSLTDLDIIGDKKVLTKNCIEQTRSTFPHAIGYEYVKLYFTEDEKKTASAIVRSTLDSFIADLPVNTWLDESTRSAAIEKAKYMIPIVGYPDWYKRTSKIEQIYSEFKVGDCHITNLEDATLGEIIFNAKSLHEKTERGMNIQGAAKTNAQYFLSENILYIPAGILQPPFYIKGRPDALNFGSLVSIIGHEITHAFDLMGRKADKFGNSVSWWSDDSFVNYIVRAECFDDQYSKYHISELDIVTDDKYKHINGTTTLSENLADNGGLETAFSAYLRYAGNETKNTRLPGIAGYSPQQLFFIGFATNWCQSSSGRTIVNDILFNEHSPSKIRTLLSLSNSDDFAKAWDCPAGATMNPDKRCKLWQRKS